MASYPQIVAGNNFSLWRRLKAMFLGKVKIGATWVTEFDKEKYPIGQFLDIYLHYCRLHRIYFLDYDHGWINYTECPKCQEASQ